MKSALRLHVSAVLAGLAFIGLAPSFALAADAANGLKLADHWCAACHLVSPAQKQASPDVSSFVDIARRKDARTLTLFLTKPHGQMPDMALSQPEVGDLVAYIQSVGPNPPPPDRKPAPPETGVSGAIAPAR